MPGNRRRMWTDSFIDETGTVSQTDEQLLIATPDLDDIGKGATLVRMVIGLSVHNSNAETADLGSLTEVVMGIGLVSPEVLVGSINVGLQDEDPMSGWLWRTRRVVTARTDQHNVLYIEADIRAQRKLMYGEPRLFITYTSQLGTAFGLTVIGLIRSLYLLP